MATVDLAGQSWGHVSSVAQPGHSFRFRGRSFLAFALAPELPIADWLGELDGWLRRSEGFFARRPVVLDLSGVTLTKYDFAGLMAELEARSIRLMGIEGADPSWLGPGLPPLLKGGRTAGGIEALDPPAPGNAPKAKGPKRQATSLLLDGPVRSGETVAFPNGDVSVVGSVALVDLPERYTLARRRRREHRDRAGDERELEVAFPERSRRCHTQLHWIPAGNK